MFSHGKGRSFHIATLERGHDCRVLKVITLASLGCQYFLLLTNPSVSIADVVDGLAQRHENRVPLRLKKRQVKISIGLFAMRKRLCSSSLLAGAIYSGQVFTRRSYRRQ